MNYFLSRDSVLKLLEFPSVYKIKTDELYELDDISFEFLRQCTSETGCEGSDANFVDYCLKEGILTTERVCSRRPVLLTAPEPSLRYLELQITKTCNLKCRHCYIGEKEKDIAKGTGERELNKDQIETILHEFEEMQGLRVLITGGEPLMHSQFREVNAVLPKFNVRSVLLTNGISLTSSILSGLNVHEIQVSIDGLEHAHDSLRGRGTFRSSLEGIRKALDKGFQVSVSTMVHAKNLLDFDEMETLFRGLGVKDWTVDVPCITGRLREQSEFQLGPAVGGKYLRYGYGEGLHTGAPGYACGTHLMAVMADGKTAKCSFYADRPLGRIEEGLRTSWQRLTPIKLDSLTCDCAFLSECRGGCRYRALLAGDELGKDFYRCQLYDILHSDA